LKCFDTGSTTYYCAGQDNDEETATADCIKRGSFMYNNFILFSLFLHLIIPVVISKNVLLIYRIAAGRKLSNLLLEILIFWIHLLLKFFCFFGERLCVSNMEFYI
jgi:hypothetical protein